MNNIIIVEKPNTIRWEEITEVIHDAYTEREKQNLHFAAFKSTPKENAQKIIDGKCFVALDGSKVVGVVFLRCPSCQYLINKNGKEKWYCDKNYGTVINLSVKEKYKSRGIGRKLLERLIEECKKQKLDSIMIDTSSKLKRLNKFYDSYGFKKVDYISWSTTNYYTVIRRLNLNGKNYNFIYRNLKYYWSKIKTLIMIDINGEKRF